MSSAPDHVKGKVIAITGAGSGFGKLVSVKAAARGAKVLAMDVNEEWLKATADAVTAAGGDILAKKVDVTNLAEFKSAVAAAVEKYGAVDVMVNNAGTMPLAFFADHEKAMDAWSRCIDINFKGVLHGMVAVYDQMIKQGRGHIINLSSIYGNYPVAGSAVYSATKSAVNFLTDTLRIEAQGKIKTTIVRPTGVPGTNLGSAVVNMDAVVGILGYKLPEYAAFAQARAEGKPLGEGLDDPDDPRYFGLAPEYIADAIMSAIDQPWGVSIRDVTVRATGDPWLL
ncbi:short chain dehydrogenase family protein 49 [Hyaloraphidium curvatum]|nr:short chain dehydrogenase family protein 49 [Hyaloraphidium curvatum]